MKLTAKEIVAKLEESGLTVEQFTGNYYGRNEAVDMEAILESLGGCKLIAQVGGEGEGDVWYTVNYFPAHDVYLRTDGQYSSYDGVYFYGSFGYEVKPAQKTITVYDKV